MHLFIFPPPLIIFHLSRLRHFSPNSIVHHTKQRRREHNDGRIPFHRKAEPSFVQGSRSGYRSGSMERSGRAAEYRDRSCCPSGTKVQGDDQGLGTLLPPLHCTALSCFLPAAVLSLYPFNDTILITSRITSSRTIASMPSSKPKNPTNLSESSPLETITPKTAMVTSLST